MKTQHVLLIGVVLATIICAPAWAWGRAGHAIVAARAQSELSPAAVAALKPLLADLDATSLADIASWADKHRNRTTAKWHYQNFPHGNCQYNRATQCRNGNCLIEAARRQTAILADPSQSTHARAKALRYVVHFVGDAFQPLHSGYASDKGGNTYQIHVQGKGTNLHHFWDTTVIYDMSPRQRKAIERGAGRHTKRTKPEVWSEHSCQIVQTPGFYPSHKPSTRYVKAAKRIAESQLRKAGDELAAVLNQALPKGAGGA